ncbi:MAG: hypothetical protein EOM49_12385, partial [Epsilonproteobacteria bacterium]|nr:hypothetical protein [Campylobacterota bacterium]
LPASLLKHPIKPTLYQLRKEIFTTSLQLLRNFLYSNTKHLQKIGSTYYFVFKVNGSIVKQTLRTDNLLFANLLKIKLYGSHPMLKKLDPNLTFNKIQVDEGDNPEDIALIQELNDKIERILMGKKQQKKISNVRIIDSDEIKPITLKEALVHSRNLATINLLSILGLDSVYKELKKDGFKSLSMDLTLALGSFGISPLEFSSFYSMFPNYGVKTEPLLVKKVINRDGVEKVYETKSTTITTPEQSFLMIDMMREVVKRGTGRNAQVAGIEIAGKTGTTNSNVDTWFCGFSPDIEIITWYGNDNNTPLKKGETGGRAAAPAFKYFMGKYLEMYPETTREFKMPEGVGSRKINGVIEYFTEQSPFPKVTIKQQQDEGGLMF